LILRLGFDTRNKTEAIGWRDYKPGTSFGAARTVAFYRSLGDIDVRLEANGAAVATAAMCFQDH
jgi:hypothetical protein